MKAIIEKQRELIELLKAPRYHEINDAIKRKESELAALESEQPKDGAKDKQRKSAENIEDYLLKKRLIIDTGIYDGKVIYQFTHIVLVGEIIRAMQEYRQLGMPSEEEIEDEFTTQHFDNKNGHHYRVKKDRIFGAKYVLNKWKGE